MLASLSKTPKGGLWSALLNALMVRQMGGLTLPKPVSAEDLKEHQCWADALTSHRMS